MSITRFTKLPSHTHVHTIKLWVKISLQTMLHLRCVLVSFFVFRRKERALLYEWLCQSLCEDLAKQLQDLSIQIEKEQYTLKEHDDHADQLALQGARVICMTIAGAAKYAHILQSLDVKASAHLHTCVTSTARLLAVAHP
jgi:hypothetical protein